MSPDSSTGIPRAAALRRRIAAMAPPGLGPSIGSSTTCRIPQMARRPIGTSAQMIPGTCGRGTAARGVLGAVDVVPLDPPVVVVVVVVVLEGVPPPKPPPPVNVPPPLPPLEVVGPPVVVPGVLLGTLVAGVENPMV